jgi:cytochrome c oxidase subunit 2
MAGALLASLLRGCSEGHVQSMTGADGAGGEGFTRLFGLFLVVTLVFYAAVLLFLLVAIARRRRSRDDRPEVEEPPIDRPLRALLIGWTGLIALVLAGLTIASWFADRGEARVAAMPALDIELTAHQWWWDARYSGPTPDRSVETANELHLPVGVPVHIRLVAADVIHSFWIPNLAGKQDMIPGRSNDITLLPTRVGRERGQCAEFCGLQHAHMSLDVIVEPLAAYRAWWLHQQQSAPAPATPLAQAGLAYVTQRECAACHNISGTGAGGRIGPDLTHVASRLSIAAGTFPMDRGHLYAWVADPQGAKPGNQMPYIGLEPGELHAVVAYLETLR